MARSLKHNGSSVRECLVSFPKYRNHIIGNHADVFDAIMIILAMLTLNLFHPGIYLRDDHPYPSPEAQTFPAGLEGTVLEDFKKTEPQSSITSIPQ